MTPVVRLPHRVMAMLRCVSPALKHQLELLILFAIIPRDWTSYIRLYK